MNLYDINLVGAPTDLSEYQSSELQSYRPSSLVPLKELIMHARICMEQKKERVNARVKCKCAR